jgi:multiple antibiotic resistance protein
MLLTLHSVNTEAFFMPCFWQIFKAICPIAVIMLYLSMTLNCTLKERLARAQLACWVAWAAMIATALGGPQMLAAIGIAMDAFNIGGGLLLIVVGSGMLGAEDPEIVSEEGGNLSRKPRQDISVAPLAIPIIAGPGTLGVVINRASEQGRGTSLLCLFAISLVIFLLYITLVLAARGAKWLAPMVLKLSFRLSGLFLVAVGVQYIMNGLKEMWPSSNTYVISSLLGY